jgi:hypothetical protein
MKRRFLLVSVLALAGLFLESAKASAQLREVSATVRVSDNVVATVYYGPGYTPVRPTPYILTGGRRVYYEPNYRWRQAEWDRYVRRLVWEHDRLHYDMRFMPPGRAKRVHEQWHRNVGFDHAWFAPTVRGIAPAPAPRPVPAPRPHHGQGRGRP